MALNKSIIQQDGVETTYHRIVKLNIMVNQLNIVEVASYLNYDGRIRQINFDVEQSEGNEPNYAPPYIATTFYQLPYNEAMTIPDAYAELKKLPVFEGATDALD